MQVYLYWSETSLYLTYLRLISMREIIVSTLSELKSAKDGLSHPGADILNCRAFVRACRSRFDLANGITLKYRELFNSKNIKYACKHVLKQVVPPPLHD